MEEALGAHFTVLSRSQKGRALAGHRSHVGLTRRPGDSPGDRSASPSPPRHQGQGNRDLTRPRVTLRSRSVDRKSPPIKNDHAALSESVPLFPWLFFVRSSDTRSLHSLMHAVVRVVSRACCTRDGRTDFERGSGKWSVADEQIPRRPGFFRRSRPGGQGRR